MVAEIPTIIIISDDKFMIVCWAILWETVDSVGLWRLSGILVSHHVLDGLLHKLNLPEWSGGSKLLSFLRNEEWQDLLFALVLVVWMEHSLDSHVSQVLVEVD